MEHLKYLAFGWATLLTLFAIGYLMAKYEIFGVIVFSIFGFFILSGLAYGLGRVLLGHE